MSPDRAAILQTRFPKLLGNVDLAINDGWFGILWSLCLTIEDRQYSRKNAQKYLRDQNQLVNYAVNNCRAEFDQQCQVWAPEVRDRMWADMSQRQLQPELPDLEPVQFEQVKEKFGALRIYHQGGDDTVDCLIGMAENLSQTVCEECGAPGQIRRGAWVRTLCDVHATQLGYA
jgi:hypothetical protein